MLFTGYAYGNQYKDETMSYPIEVIVKSDNVEVGSSSSSLSEHDPLNNKSKYGSVSNQEIQVFLTCKLCLDERIPKCDMFIISSCNCNFCKECMQSYVEVLIGDGVVLAISCPDAECPKSGIISKEEIQLLTQPETFEKYQRLKFEQEVAIDPHRTFCPQVSCSTVCHLCSNSTVDHAVIQNPVSVSCPTCQLKFCSICKAEWRPDHSCAIFSRSFGSELQRLQARAGLTVSGEVDILIKRCPVCNILIEKDQGCAQMICKHCSHVFCWYCLKLLDNDYLLRHYDKGPCRNMLGHSRWQVFRHRIGVVGLFGAFSLLLVVASPVLLIVAPFLICWKCKECCQQVMNQANQHRGSFEMDLRNHKENEGSAVSKPGPDSPTTPPPQVDNKESSQ